MDYTAQLKAIGEAQNLRLLIDAKVSEHAKTDSQILENEKEMARLEGLQKTTENLKEKRGDLLKTLAELNAELGKRMKKLNEEGVELPLLKDIPRAIVRL